MNPEDRERIRAIAERLNKPLPLSERILRVLRDGPTPANEIAAALSDGERRDWNSAICKSLRNMERSGRIRRRQMFQPEGRRVVCRPLEVWERVA
jgi:hypothetical protein